jgi:hypothetical protein
MVLLKSVIEVATRSMSHLPAKLKPDRSGISIWPSVVTRVGVMPVTVLADHVSHRSPSIGFSVLSAGHGTDIFASTAGRAVNDDKIPICGSRRYALASRARKCKPGINGPGDLSEALCGSAPCHLGIGRAVLVDVADAGLGLHVDIRIRRVLARDARADFQHHRICRAAVL